MKNLILIFGLLTLVSCGSGRPNTPTQDWTEDCALDLEDGNDCEVPPIELPIEPPIVEVEKIFENMTSITYKGNVLPLTLVSDIDGITYRQFRLEMQTDLNWDFTLIQFSLFEDGRVFVRFEYNNGNELTYPETWSLTEDGTFSFGDKVLTVTFANQE